MRYLLTGATGYIGSHLATSLADAGSEVHAIVRPTSNLEILDPRIQAHVLDDRDGRVHEIIGQCEPDLVLHLATQQDAGDGATSWRSVRDSNIEFGCQLLEAMSYHRVKNLVNAGSYWEYGLDGRFEPNCYYAATKRAFQDIITYHARHGGIRAISLVLYDVYGADDWRGKFLNRLLEAAKSDNKIPATPGDQLIGLTHINDAVAGFRIAARRVDCQEADAGHEVWFLKPDAIISLRDLVGRMNDISGGRIQVDWGQNPYRSSQIMEPYSDGEALPKWRPTVSLDQGLRELLRFYDLGPAKI